MRFYESDIVDLILDEYLNNRSERTTPIMESKPEIGIGSKQVLINVPVLFTNDY